MVMTVKMALKVDRVGLFVLSEDKRSMILKVSERAKGVRLPVRGIAGAVLLVRVCVGCTVVMIMCLKYGHTYLTMYVCM